MSERSTDGSNYGESLANFIDDESETATSERSDNDNASSSGKGTGSVDDLVMIRQELENLNFACMVGDRFFNSP